MSTVSLTVVSVLTLSSLCIVSEVVDYSLRSQLSPKIKNYWPTYIDSQSLLKSHRQLNNKSAHSSGLAVYFTSYARPVLLQLKRQTNVYSPSALTWRVNEDGVHRVALDLQEFYVGTVSGEDSSWAHGFVAADGLFEGSFHLAGVRYHVEPASHYSHIALDGKLFNTIIYSEMDVDHDYKLAEPLVGYNLHAALNSSVMSTQQHLQSGQHRQARSVVSKRLCSIYLVADYLFYKNAGKEDFLYTFRYIHMLLNEASHIIEQQDFSDFSVGFTSIGFVVEGLMIYETSTQDPFHGPGLSVHELLSKLADQTLDQFCLAHLLTYHDFQSGIVGLAYTAKTGSSYSGGICSKRVKTKDGMKNLNCGLSSGINYQEALPRMVHSLVMAHELGHNLGSHHDTDVCTASGRPRGHFLMFKAATDGSQPNNRKFSHCSMTQIGEVLNEKGSCLTEYEPQCGNKVLEDGEECDCGTPRECNDACCDPHKCQLVGDAECSPSASFTDVDTCCTVSCKFAPSNHTCREETECALQSTCSGVSANCADAVPKPDGKACAGGLKICQAGICSGSFCTHHGVSECKCLDESSCDICCRYQNKTCLQVQGWVQLEQLSNVAVSERFLMPGTPCNNYSGYCTTDGICDPSGSNAALDDLNQEVKAWFETQLKNAPEWMKDNWYWIVVSVLVLIVIGILGYGLCCCRRGHSSADDQFATMDLRTLKATLAEGGEANKLISSGQAAVPKAREDKSRIDNCNQTNSGLLGDRNSLEAADGSSNKHSDDEKPAGRHRSGSVKESRYSSRHRAQARRNARSISQGRSSPKAPAKSPSKTSSDGDTNPIHSIAESAAKLAEGANALGNEHTDDLKRGRRHSGPKVTVQPSASGGYYAVTEKATPRVTGSWSRELEQPVLSGVFKSRKHDSDREECFPHRQSYSEVWRGPRQELADPEENYRIRELSRKKTAQQSYLRGRTSPLQLSQTSNARTGGWERPQWTSGGRSPAYSRNHWTITMSDTELSDDAYGSGYRQPPRRRGRRSSTPNSTVRPSSSFLSLSDAPCGRTNATSSHAPAYSIPQQSVSDHSSAPNTIRDQRGGTRATGPAESHHYRSPQQRYARQPEPKPFSFNKQPPISSCSVSSSVGHPHGQPRSYWSSWNSHQTTGSRPCQAINAPHAQRGTHNSDLILTSDV